MDYGFIGNYNFKDFFVVKCPFDRTFADRSFALTRFLQRASTFHLLCLSRADNP